MLRLDIESEMDDEVGPRQREGQMDLGGRGPWRLEKESGSKGKGTWTEVRLVCGRTSYQIYEVRTYINKMEQCACRPKEINQDFLRKERERERKKERLSWDLWWSIGERNVLENQKRWKTVGKVDGETEGYGRV